MNKVCKVHPIREKKPKRVVNIIGMAPSACTDIVEGELWGINHAWIYGHKLDVMFAMDGLDKMLQALKPLYVEVEEYIGYIKYNKDMKLITAYEQSLNWNGEIVKKAEGYPLGFLQTMIPGSYSNSSISHVLAYAAMQEKLGNKKIDVINLYGIELWSSFDKNEYEYQRACVDFWIPFLYGRDIQVNIPAYLLYAADTKWNMYGFAKGGR